MQADVWLYLRCSDRLSPAATSLSHHCHHAVEQAELQVPLVSPNVQIYPLSMPTHIPIHLPYDHERHPKKYRFNIIKYIILTLNLSYFSPLVFPSLQPRHLPPHCRTSAGAASEADLVPDALSCVFSAPRSGNPESAPYFVPRRPLRTLAPP